MSTDQSFETIPIGGFPFEPGDALLVVDVQIDFCPGGALAVPEGDRVVPILAAWIREAHRCGVPIFASRDWHPLGHPSFESEGGPWPPHCLQDSPGAAFHPGLELPPDTVVVTKGTRFDRDQYSAFAETGLGDRLRRDRVRRLWVGGLALDVCVLESALEARRQEFAVRLLADATRAVDPGAESATLARLAAAGVEICVPEREAARDASPAPSRPEAGGPPT